MSPLYTEKINIQNAVLPVLLYHFSNFGILSYCLYRFCTESPAVILCTEFSFSIFFCTVKFCSSSQAKQLYNSLAYPTFIT